MWNLKVPRAYGAANIHLYLRGFAESVPTRAGAGNLTHCALPFVICTSPAPILFRTVLLKFTDWRIFSSLFGVKSGKFNGN